MKGEGRRGRGEETGERGDGRKGRGEVREKRDGEEYIPMHPSG